MFTQGVDVMAYAQALIREFPQEARVQAIGDVVAAAAAAGGCPNEALQGLLEASASLLLFPEHTLGVGRAMGPLLLEVVARALRKADDQGFPRGQPGVLSPAAPAAAFATMTADAARDLGCEDDAMPAAERAERVLVVMSRLLPSAPHALPLALQYWRSSTCPFDCLRGLASATAAAAAAVAGSPGASSPSTREEQEPAVSPAADLLERRTHAVTEAAHKLISCQAVSASLRDAWNWSPFFKLCRHGDALVRWRAASVCAALLGLDDRGRRELVSASAFPASDSKRGHLAIAREPQTASAKISVDQRSSSCTTRTMAAEEEASSSALGKAPLAIGRGGGGDACVTLDAILNAELDLSEELRRAPTSLCPPPPQAAKKAEVSDRVSSAAGDSPTPADTVTASTGVSSGAASASPTFHASTYRNHHSVADIGGILHAKTAPAAQHGRQHGGPGEASVGGGGGRSAGHPSFNRNPGGGGDGSGGGGQGHHSQPRLVPTPSASRNLSSLSLAMAVNRPILLHGPAGSGKSLLVREAARLASGNHGDADDSSPPLLELYLDDQTDSKSLLGAHACTDIPGEFAWRPGALTRAAADGTWVVIEDLDRAPFEVLAALGPLLEGRPLALPGRTKPLRAAPGFRLFGTVTTMGPGRVVLGGAADFGALWTHVPVEPLSTQETLELSRIRHPGLPLPALKRLLNTMVAAKGNLSGERSGSGSGFANFRSAGGREPGVRDFLKLCARVEVSGVFDGCEMGVVRRGHDEEEDSGDGAWFCSEAQALPVVAESLDVFAGHLTSKDALAHAAEVVAGLWNVLPSKAVDLVTSSRPDLVQEDAYINIGRVTLPTVFSQVKSSRASSSFAPTSHALRLMENVAAAVKACEPVLLVGETGCGKTALVQRLAEGTKRDLVVQNLSLQTDGADLLGGFRPVELRQLAQEVLEEFLRLFPLLFSATQNARFCQAITSSFERRQWKRLSAGLRNAAKMATDKLDRARSEPRPELAPTKSPLQKANKSQRSSVAGGSTSPSGQRRDWDRFSSKAHRFERQRVAVEGSFAFSFVEGALVSAIREGKWVLLDEINLASAETLQRLSGLLEGAEGSICLTERGDVEPVVRHEDFRLFAAMNPPTDVSKKDLPPALRRRFSEVYVPELEDRLDLKRVADGYLAGVSLEQEHLALTSVDLYLWARGLAAESLSDGAGQRPRYSLRTLVGALSAARRLVDRGFSPKRAMVEGFRGAFETQLDGDGRAKILKGILKAFGKGMTSKDLEKPPRRPGGRGGASSPWVRVGPFWLEGGPREAVDAAKLDPTTKQRKFVLTTSVEGTLRCLARAVASADSPVLLQGPTSAGKTSIVEYLAARLGHRCVRINNHEHTDIQEYTGIYAADGNGKLGFQEGVLVESLRKGYWIILDELNLAPSEVLEALNRLLDHNRELYLSETQETVKPHHNFRLFATQNPPGAYGGRKPLSRAFRNRFMEVHVDDIPGSEWEVILADRCGLPPSHCKLLVKVLHELQAQRQSSRLFLGKHGAISPRDLLRWAGRKPQGKQQLAEEGYMLLAERLRSEEEKAAMRIVLEEQIGVLVDPACLYGTSPAPSQQQEKAEQAVTSCEDSQGSNIAGDADSMATLSIDEGDLGGFAQLSVVEAMLSRGQGLEAGLQGVAMTRHMRRLFRLSGRCLSHEEPLLLVGETGCGKTTVCQLYSMLLRRRMHVVNCHQNTEAADLLGGLRPLRGRELLVQELQERAHEFLRRCALKANEDGGDKAAWAKMDVTAVMAIVQAAWTNLVQLAREREATAATEDVKLSSPEIPAASEQPSQKRARPSKSDPDQTGTTESSGGTPNQGHSPAISASSSGGSDTPVVKGKGRGKRRRSGTGVTAPGDKPRPPPPVPSTVMDGKDPGELSAEVVTQPVVILTEEMAHLEVELASLKALAMRTKGLFEWVDGPLVTAMRNGDLILLDELSLAEDAVLERLNSVLEPGRSITLAEKGGEAAAGGQGAAEIVVAAAGFRVMATMNPGGDFGKRELSPALRSRFTEVWVPALSDREDMDGVVQKAFHYGTVAEAHRQKLAEMAGPMLDFAWWFNNTASPTLGGGHGLSLSVRDLLSWAGFITSSLSSGSIQQFAEETEDRSEGGSDDVTFAGSVLRPWEAYVHGAALVLLDGMGLGSGLSPVSVARLRKACSGFLAKQLPDCPERGSALEQVSKDGGIESSSANPRSFEIRPSSGLAMSSHTTAEGAGEPASNCDSAGVLEFGVDPFFTACGPLKAMGTESDDLKFSLKAPTTASNLHRVLRALQVNKAVLLEGSPGVGKTSLISALAAAAGHELVRINLSEQTDVSDLFGSDLPVPDSDAEQVSAPPPSGDAPITKGGGSGARFAWCDGVFLRALKAGHWVLLDELNLATQSVLEGLNACLDHRAEVYIPELGRSFRCPPTFKVFAAQNPLGQGGGRKGLPKSFLSRFTKVFVDPLTPGDLLLIAENKFPALAAPASDIVIGADEDEHEQGGAFPSATKGSLLSRMIAFNSSVQEDTMKAGRYGRRGSPWEFNLRDVFRWCELMHREQALPEPLTGHGSDWEPWLVVDTLYVQRMRTRRDRNALLSRFHEAFPEAFLESSSERSSELDSIGVPRGGIGTHPVLRITPEWLQVGRTVLRRGCWRANATGCGSASDEIAAGFPMATALRRPLQALSRCVAMGWPALVVGHRGSGKSSIIKGLAAGVGARLTEVAMTPSVDVTELLGCFEQTDASSEQEALHDTLHILVEHTCHTLLREGGGDAAMVSSSVWDAWFAVRRSYRNPLSPGISQGFAAVSGFDAQGIAATDNLISSVRAAFDKMTAIDSSSAAAVAPDGGQGLRQLVKLATAQAESVRRQWATESRADSGGKKSKKSAAPASCFCWKDGVLVEALERGDWVVLDGANLCSASVLDRLNPLLEPGGVLLLTECGTSSDLEQVDGLSGAASHRVIRPHPNFRLFLTADPACGEVSRAMRNRCVEISLLDTPPAVAATLAHCAPLGPASEHCVDLLALVRASGLSDPVEAAALVAVHSALVGRRCRGNASNGEGPTPRALILWSELSEALRRRSSASCTENNEGVLRWSLDLAYPGLHGASGSMAERNLAEACLAACLGSAGGSNEGADLLDSLAPPGWRELVEDGIAGQVAQDVKVLRLVLSAAAGLGDARSTLLSHAFGSIEGGNSPGAQSGDLCLEQGDQELMVSLSSPDSAARDVALSNMKSHAAAVFSRNAGSGDRHCRSVISSRLLGASNPNPVDAFMAVLFDSDAWIEVSEMLSEMSSQEDAPAATAGSLLESAAVSTNKWSPADPRVNPDLFRSLSKTFQASPKWEPCLLLLNLIDATISLRLALILKERAEVDTARGRITAGRGGEAGLGWLGLSCLICEGGRDSSRGGARGRGGCPETRLARSALAPFLLPLLRAVDTVVSALVCRDAVEMLSANRSLTPGQEILRAVLDFVRARDTISDVLAPPSNGVPGPDASAGGGHELLFLWDPFLVAWEWLQQAFDALQMAVSTNLDRLAGISPALASLRAVGARVDAAILEHAGGAAPGRDTLWKRGPRAAAPAKATGALALGRMHRLADTLRVTPVPGLDRGVDGEHLVVSLGGLIGLAHPALCVSVGDRRELLHGLCTLHWALTSEQESKEPVKTPAEAMIGLILSDTENGEGSTDGARAASLAQRLPKMLEDMVESARDQFKASHKGTRLGAADRQDGLNQDDVELGERFDDFDTEAAEAVANATLLVVSDGEHMGGGGEGDGAAGDGSIANRDSLLQDWAFLQLAPLREHWIAAEECDILAYLANIGCLVGVPGDPELDLVMARVARLRSAILATPSLSPAVARPYQTLLWAWEDPHAWPAVSRPLLSTLLPVALESFARRLWENLAGTPGAISLQLAPPQMVSHPAVVNGHRCGSAFASDSNVHEGPVQLLTLARSSFLLRLASTASFRGGIVPGGGLKGGEHGAVDLTLMNASARQGQFRAAMRAVRDLRYRSTGALKPLVELSWARLCRTLAAFDVEADDLASVTGNVPHSFRQALSPATSGSLSGAAWEEIQAPLTRSLEACSDERISSWSEVLVVPAVQALAIALDAVSDKGEGPTPRVEASAGLGMALLGCLNLELLLPSSPVDPGLRPALKRDLLEERLAGVSGELTVRHWSLRLEGGGDVSPEMMPLLRQARGLRDQCHRLGREAIERPEDRPSFHALFRDVHAFSRGVGNPSRVTVLAEGLARLVSGGGKGIRPVDRAGLLQEESVWQAAAGAFVGRCRAEYREAYVDVVTGICDSVEATRTGLRVLAAAADRGHAASEGRPGSGDVRPLARLQTMLLSYPYSCRDGEASGFGLKGDPLGGDLEFALRPESLEGLDGKAGAAVSGAQHMTMLQAVLSRAELLLQSGCSEKPALDAALAAIEAAVGAWSRLEAEKAEKLRKEAEILKYKMHEHSVVSEEVANLAKLRALFPDYHSSFKDLVIDEAHSSAEPDDAGDESRVDPDDEDAARIKALGQLSEDQLASLVARHARIFLSLSSRRRLAARALGRQRGVSAGIFSTGGSPASKDAARLAAFGDSYRAAVLLANPTSKLFACCVVPSGDPAGGRGDGGNVSKVLQLEESFAASHLFALANGTKLCKSGKSLLEESCADAAGGVLAIKGKAQKSTKKKGNLGVSMLGDAFGVGWVGEGAAGRTLLLVDPLTNFHLDPNVAETRLADGPLAAVLRRVAGLLEEFPGHGVLIQLARVADRVRRMPLHSPLAAVLAGVELTLRKAQDWEQHAHRGVSLKEELRCLSALVVRWRAVELKSWAQLLGARERSSALKANRWWLHLFRLLTGEWGGDQQETKDILQGSLSDTTGQNPGPPVAAAHVERVFPSPDWPSARGSFPDWLWCGLVTETAGKGKNTVDGTSKSGMDKASLDHARGLFQSLDDFLRTSSIGEFFARLQMLRAFAAQLRETSSKPAAQRGSSRALATVLQGLWQFYSQFSDEVVSARELVRTSIEKKLKEEAKLAKWDEQTYYSLAESSENSHRKLTKLVSQYDEVLEVSVSEVLHRTLIAGIGERKEGNAAQPVAPCTEIPSVGSMFSFVKKVDSATDLVDDDAEQAEDAHQQNSADGETPPAPPAKTVRQRPTSKSSPETSLQVLDACLPKEPAYSGKSEDHAGFDHTALPVWLRESILGTPDATVVSKAAAAVSATSLTARLPALAQRMSSLLQRGVYARRRAAKGKGLEEWGWADGGRPAGFVGAGLAEELCLAVFGRIQALRAKGVGKQVKKRAVLDLLGGMRKQGLLYAKSATPFQTTDMLQVMSLAQPFSADRLAGMDRAWLFAGHGKCVIGGGVAWDMLERAERYYLRGVSELSRLRLEAGAPVSRDVTRREAEVMRGLSDHLGLLVLQQRGAAAALESELFSLVQEIHAIHSLASDAQDDTPATKSSDCTPSVDLSARRRSLPPQTPLTIALETQRRGLLCGLEGVREVGLLVRALTDADPGSSSPSAVDDGGKGWGKGAIDTASAVAMKGAVSGLETSLSDMLGRLECYPTSSVRTGAGSTGVAEMNHSDGFEAPVPPLLSVAAVGTVLNNQKGLMTCAIEAKTLAGRFANVAPPAALTNVGGHLSSLSRAVGAQLDTSPLMRSFLADSASADGIPKEHSGDSADDGDGSDARVAAEEHAAKIGSLLSEAVKAMLLSVQALCPRDSESQSRVLPNRGTGGVIPEGNTNGDGGEEEDAEGWSTGTTLFDAHASAFEQARGLKLWRCASAMSAARSVLKDFTEDEVVCGSDGRAERTVALTSDALVSLFRDVVGLAEQVFAAGQAVLIGMVALNKGTAKLHYVTVRVFRTLLSKGLCADETEEGEGEGEGDIDGMKFDDDVEGTGMGEGEGKKDVTDQIEDEEQLLGLKGDEPDKDQAEESKELDEKEEDTGMEMENDFEGEMFDVPKGDDKEDPKDDEEKDEKEELDREMGDLGDNADVVDEKLWDEDEEDDEGDEEGKDQGEEKFEAGSRLDGEKPDEDEIRTKEDGQEEKKPEEGDGKEDDAAKGEEDNPKKDDGDDPKGTQEGQDEDEEGGQGDDGSEGDGPVNDDLEDNYEEKPMGVEVRGEDEAMEVDEKGREAEGGEEKDGEAKGEDEDLPDDLNLDNNVQEDEGAEEGDGDAKGDDEGEEEEGKEKEGFESLGPEDNGEEEGEDLKEDDQQPQGSGTPGAPELDPAEKDAEGDTEKDDQAEEDKEEDVDHEEETTKPHGEEQPPAFGVQGDGGDSSVIEAAKEEGEGKQAEDEKGEEEDEEREEGQDGGGNAPDGRDDGGGGGQGDDGEGGEWRPDMSGGEGRGEGQGNDKRRRPEAPNPFRDPGDAMRHWHRRLDMLKEKEDANQGEGAGEDQDADEGKKDEEDGGDSGEGKFEYVTGNERGSSQVLGGVSEEQAAEAAAHQSDPMQEENDDAVAKDGEGDEDDLADGIDAMDEDDEPNVPQGVDPVAMKQDLEGERAESGDPSRKSGNKRDKDGHEAEPEDRSEMEDETSAVTPDKAPLDLDSLEEQPSGDGDPRGNIVTNPLGADQRHPEDDPDTERRRSAKGQEARLREELHALAEELQRKRRDRDDEGGEEDGMQESRELWGRLRGVTGALAQRLCEQLRLVLEPMVATKLQGDYRSGKRINMRRVIPYIASGFRKDKIWLRRTKPAKRDYQILMAIDDSESMADCGAGALALAAMTTVASGLTQLEAGQLAVARFGQELDLLHGFGDPFTEEAGAKIVKGFTFDQSRTNTALTLEGVVSLLEEARNNFSFSSGGVGTRGTPRQLVLLLSDGRFDRDNKERLRKLVREMNERGQLLVLIVLDKDGDTSILKTREASYVNGKLVLSSYLDKYPFPLYILLNHVEALPETLADALRQWFELLQRQSSS